MTTAHVSLATMTDCLLNQNNGENVFTNIFPFGLLECKLAVLAPLTADCAAGVCLFRLISPFNWYQKISEISQNLSSEKKLKKKHTETWLFCRPYRTPRTSWLRRRGRRESKRRKRVEGKPRPQTTSELFRPDLYSCGETKHAHANSSNWQHIYKSGLNTDAVFLHTCCPMYAENVNNRSAVCHIYRLISLNENTSDKTREGKSQYYYFLYRIIPTKFCWLFSSSSDKTSKNFENMWS